MTDIVEAVTDELLAHGEFSSGANNRSNARIAAEVVINMVRQAASQGSAGGGHDPADIWDAYCEEVPAERRSHQGALAFGFAAALSPPVKTAEFSGIGFDETEEQYITRLEAEIARLRCLAQGVKDPILTPRHFLDDILAACDASNWDADRNKGDYYRGLNDAYETILNIAVEYQTSIYAWCKREATSVPSADRGCCSRCEDTSKCIDGCVMPSTEHS